MIDNSKHVTKNLKIGGVNFLISVYHQEGHSWQGSIQWLDTGKKLHFRSELELINLIQSAIQSSQEKDIQLRNWLNQ